MKDNQNSLMNGLLLGAGGSKPGLWQTCSGEEGVQNLLELPVGHSVYAIDIDPEQGLIAVGTRVGTVEVLSYSDSDQNHQPQSVASLVQGVPVLTVCLLDGGRLASTDTAGRCLLWDWKANPNEPEIWQSEKGVICSLLRLPEQRMITLSSEGKLMLWDMARDDCLQTLNGPVPPSRLSLVHLTYWSAQHAAVYPAADGRLVIWPIEGQTVQAVHAHEGEFYAAIVSGEELITIGTEDAQVKTWRNPHEPPVKQAEAPQGVISGNSLSAGSNRLLLIDDRSRTAIYELGAERLKLLHRHNTDRFRVVAGPSSRDVDVFKQGRLLARVREVQFEIQERIRTRHGEGIDPLHQQLVGWGFESVSLALRAQHAAHQNNVVEEIRIRQRLMHTLPPDDPRGVASIRRYATLLESVWQASEAQRIINCLPDEDEESSTMRSWLTEIVTIMSGDVWIGPQCDLAVLIDAASQLHQPFVGRWLVHVHGHLPFPEARLSAEELAAKFEQIKAETRRSDLPTTRVRRMHWLQSRAHREIDTVLLEDAGQHAQPGSRMAVLVYSDGSRCTAAPVTLFHAGPLREEHSVEEHNALVLHSYKSIRDHVHSSAWCPKAQRALTHALRRLRNMARSEWMLARRHETQEQGDAATPLSEQCCQEGQRHPRHHTEEKACPTTLP